MHLPVIIIIIVTLIVPVNSVSHIETVFMFHNTLGKKNLFRVSMQTVG